jgi:hypothetical protein
MLAGIAGAANKKAHRETPVTFPSVKPKKAGLYFARQKVFDPKAEFFDSIMESQPRHPGVTNLVRGKALQIQARASARQLARRISTNCTSAAWIAQVSDTESL